MGRETEPYIETEISIQELDQIESRIDLETPLFIECIYDEIVR